jgi:hypothetical protein
LTCSRAVPSLVIVGRALTLNEDRLIAAGRLLKQHIDRKDDAFFARRGFKDARDGYARYLHLSGVIVLDEATSPARADYWANREARHRAARTPGPVRRRCRAVGVSDAELVVAAVSVGVRARQPARAGRAHNLERRLDTGTADLLFSLLGVCQRLLHFGAICDSPEF